MTIKEFINTHEHSSFVFDFDVWDTWWVDSVETFVKLGGIESALDEYYVEEYEEDGIDREGNTVYSLIIKPVEK